MKGYRNILAVVSDSETGRSSLETAFLVGRDYAGHVEALHVRNDPTAAVPLVGEGMSGAMVEEMIGAAERQINDRATAARQLFEHLASERAIRLAAAPPAEDVTAVWREEVGREEDLVARLGRVADLMVIGRPLPDRDVPSLMTLNAGLMETGRPLLVAPPEPPNVVGRHVVVAWNGSAEAARAVAAAMPFLEKAAKVCLLTAREDEEMALMMGELAGSLSWHGISAHAHSFHPGSGNIGEILLREAAAFNADLLVMGAYTHSRLRQLILGGVTRYVLNHASIPVLLTH